MQLLRQRWPLQGVVKNSRNLGGAKAGETKKNFKRRNARGKNPARELGRAEKSGKTRLSRNENVKKCHFNRGPFKAGVDYNRFST